jgi:hypothetical protein
MEGQGFDLTHQRWLTGGRSGCYVAVVTLKPGCGKARGAVLKLFPPALAAKESRGVHLAKQNSPPAFYRTHLVDTIEVDPLPNSSWWLHIQAVADADLGRIRPLAELIDDPEFARYCELVTSTITDGWDEGRPDPAPLETTVSGFMIEHMEDRMPQLAEFAAAARLDLKQPPPTICLAGGHNALPNPLAALNSTVGAHDAALNSTVGAHDSVTIYTGNGHGDLHVRNVLMLPGANTFRMIDYGRFSPSTPVSRDPIKLMLSIVEHWLPDLVPLANVRTRLAEVIVRPHKTVPNAAVGGYLNVIKRIFDAASAWGQRRDLVTEWHRQYLLVLASSALRSAACGDIAMRDRWWYFELSALAIADLVKAATTNEHGHESRSRRHLTDFKDTDDQFDFWFDVLTHPTA